MNEVINNGTEPAVSHEEIFFDQIEAVIGTSLESVTTVRQIFNGGNWDDFHFLAQHITPEIEEMFSRVGFTLSEYYVAPPEPAPAA